MGRRACKGLISNRARAFPGHRTGGLGVDAHKGLARRRFPGPGRRVPAAGWVLLGAILAPGSGVLHGQVSPPTAGPVSASVQTGDGPRIQVPGPGDGEEASHLLGIVLGPSSSRQLWDYTFDSEGEEGGSLGVFIEVPTPVRHLSLRAEAAYLLQAARVWNPQVDPGREGESEVRTHSLSFPFHGKLTFGVGPLTLYGFGGPTLGVTVNTECRADFCPFLAEEAPTTFAVAVGAGLGGAVAGRWEAGAEVRLTEGLSEAYSNRDSGVRWRTVELLLRVGAWR